MVSDRECRENMSLEDISPPKSTDYGARSMMLLVDSALMDTPCIFLPYLASIGPTQQSTGPL
jgi:hypothetical protein